MTVSLPDVHVWSPSRPGEFHPEPLTDPDLSLSAHPARATLGKLPPSARTGRFLLLPVDQIDPDAGDPPPSLHGHYSVSSVLRGSPPLTGALVFRPRGATACAFSLIIASQVLKFHTKARMRFTPPEHRTPHGP